MFTYSAIKLQFTYLHFVILQSLHIVRTYYDFEFDRLFLGAFSLLKKLLLCIHGSNFTLPTDN